MAVKVKILRLNPELPEPWIIIPVKVIESFQNLSYIGELRQRWEEIKRLQINPAIVAIIPQNLYNLPG
ncbi:MAG: hypothetical protein A2W22_00450 [Candidatus Levybacteria bacterium RBG_16_35_11]|nr:MAG: hypothetical protein A2W22_00450 [Candidatus Levybacteria bacterium RBG_16_35_11]